jgi:outer membrane protein OmpA-like peptidoglycan-associated protein
MKRNLIIILLIFLPSVFINAQNLVDISNTSTCEQAYDISRFHIFGPTTAPAGIGKVRADFTLVKHPTWYKFTVQKNGILMFDIIPLNSKDNYDFMLFKDEPNFCKKYKEGNIKPVRSNFDPPANKKGITGLSYTGEEQDFEKAVPVSKGDVFYLVLNNMYNDGKGHTVFFKELKTITINGKITDSKNGKPLKSDIRWRNLRNNNLFVSSQTEKKGSYEMEILLNSEENSFPKYELCVYADKYFPDYKVFSTEQANTLNGKEIDFALDKVKKGLNNETLGVIYFTPNDIFTVPKSEYVKQKLLKFMKLNPKAKIILEGHTNGLFPSTDVDFKLSAERAEVVKKYLTDNGIDPSRIETEGMGSKNEIYPIPETEEEEGYNRRVEIRVTNF